MPTQPAVPFHTILPYHLQTLEKIKVSRSTVLHSSINPSCPLVTQGLNIRGLRAPLCDLVVSGKEKLHFLHRDGEEGMVAVMVKALVSGTGVTFSGRRQISLWLGLGETHAGDTEETDEASVLEVLESSELSSTFFPKSCKMLFRNWQDRKCYSAEQEGLFSTMLKGMHRAFRGRYSLSVTRMTQHLFSYHSQFYK